MDTHSRNWRILVVDDDENTAILNKTLLEDAGFEASAVLTGEDCLAYVAATLPDLILLDVELPGISGFEVCRQVRSQDDLVQPGIIMLTGLKDVPNKVTGLEGGADDYLTKPYEPSELLARVRAQLRIRDLQNKLRKTDRLAIIGQAAIALSHKINTPLTTIIWKVRLVQGDLRTIRNVPESLIDGLESIVEEANRIEHVLKQLHEINELSFTQYDDFHMMLDLDKSATHDQE